MPHWRSAPKPCAPASKLCPRDYAPMTSCPTTSCPRTPPPEIRPQDFSQDASCPKTLNCPLPGIQTQLLPSEFREKCLKSSQFFKKIQGLRPLTPTIDICNRSSILRFFSLNVKNIAAHMTPLFCSFTPPVARKIAQNCSNLLKIFRAPRPLAPHQTRSQGGFNGFQNPPIENSIRSKN